MNCIVIAVGNTNCRVAAMGGGELLRPATIIPTRALNTSTLAGIMRGQAAAFPQPRIVLCSVVPAAVEAAVSACIEACGTAPLQVKPERVDWMKIRYEPVSDLGADRLCVLLGARLKHGYPIVAVDFGTAVTVNVIDRNGAFAGGCIFPGMAAALRALNTETAQLPLPGLPEQAPPLLARSTTGSLRSGVYWSVVLGIEGIATRLEQEFGKDFPVILTGGGMRAAAAVMSRRCVMDEHLLLYGAAEYAERAEGGN